MIGVPDLCRCFDALVLKGTLQAVPNHTGTYLVCLFYCQGTSMHLSPAKQAALALGCNMTCPNA